MKKQLIMSMVMALMVPLLALGQEESNAHRRKSWKSDNPNNARSTASRKDSARVMKKGDMNNKMGTTQKPASKKMAKNRADQ
jgi:hypothetical protein